MKTYKLIEEDVIDIANTIGKTLTEKEIEWVLLCYEDSQRQDPIATWNLVVENLIYQVEIFKIESHIKKEEK
jgi:hypothetical protein